MSDQLDEVDAVLLEWVRAGGSAAEVERRTLVVRARFTPSPAPSAPAPPTPTSTPPPAPRVPIMDLSRPSLTPPPREPWRNPEFDAEIERMKSEMAEIFAQARDPFFDGRKTERECNDDSRTQIGLGKRRR